MTTPLCMGTPGNPCPGMDMPGGENEPLPSSLTPDELGGIPGIGGKLGIMGWPA